MTTGRRAEGADRAMSGDGSAAFDAGRVRICIAYPLATQSQGDEGNAEALVHRARLRGATADIVVHHGPEPLPACDIYVTGGLDESGTATLARLLHEGGLGAHVAGGAGLLAVNAGFQAIGTWFVDESGARRPGLGLVDVAFTRGTLIEGPAVVVPDTPVALPEISGYESHFGRPSPGSGATRLGRHILGRRDAAALREEGVVAGAVIGTFLHGPVLARNPALADLLLVAATGRNWPPASPGWGDRVRMQRIAEDRSDPTGWGGTRYARSLPSLRRGRRGSGAEDLR